jgi:hypothetical protein
VSTERRVSQGTQLPAWETTTSAPRPRQYLISAVVDMMAEQGANPDANLRRIRRVFATGTLACGTFNQAIGE